MAKNEFALMTPEERAEAGRKGGIASGEAKRRKKAMKETLEVFLSMPMKNGKFTDIDAVKNFAALKGKNISVQEAMVVSMLQRAMHGDVRAAEWIRDTAGQKPVDIFAVSEIDPAVIAEVENLVNDTGTSCQLPED